jgi:hypothetical protein
MIGAKPVGRHLSACGVWDARSARLMSATSRRAVLADVEAPGMKSNLYSITPARAIDHFSMSYLCRGSRGMPSHWVVLEAIASDRIAIGFHRLSATH